MSVQKLTIGDQVGYRIGELYKCKVMIGINEKLVSY